MAGPILSLQAALLVPRFFGDLELLLNYLQNQPTLHSTVYTKQTLEPEPLKRDPCFPTPCCITWYKPPGLSEPVSALSEGRINSCLMASL